MPHTPRRTDQDWTKPAVEERVVERRYYESGGLQWERAGLRTSQPPALPPGPRAEDPIWFEALVWTFGAFWRGIVLVGEAVLTVCMLIVGLVLGVLAIAAAVALVAGVIGAGYGIGSWIGGPSGATTGAWIAVGAVVLTLMGAANRNSS